MRVAEIMTTDTLTCLPEDSLEVVAHHLWHNDCGMLPVVDLSGRVGAAITDRDVCMGAFTRGSRLSDLRVADSMSSDIACCRPEDDLVAAAGTMAERGIRRLPVVDDDGRPCGMLSLNDLVLASRGNSEVGKLALDVMHSICTHRDEHGKSRRRSPSAAGDYPGIGKMGTVAGDRVLKGHG